MRKRILITGGAGFIGSPFASRVAGQVAHDGVEQAAAELRSEG
ncbi:MAG TPA: hypothetical protein VKK06_18335 [Terriglobia bacterium]|nr:hypothetical protein [Terriglobia bacterium]